MFRMITMKVEGYNSPSYRVKRETVTMGRRQRVEKDWHVTVVKT